ncbi:MAG: hypothetical protein HQL49_01125 [Gammaproteobacteria bacterium]|nr:hypothetical protein [Gammaproteobacteria bacterium]
MIKILWSSFLAVVAVTLISCGDQADIDVDDKAFVDELTVSTITLHLSSEKLKTGEFLTISGTVRDSSGKAVVSKNVVINIFSVEGMSMAALSVTTDDSGSYEKKDYAIPVHFTSSLYVQAVIGSKVSEKAFLRITDGVDASGVAGVYTISVIVSNSQLAVKDVGENEITNFVVTVNDSNGKAIDDTAYNNLKLTIVASPGGGERLSGTAMSGEKISSDSAILISTKDGVSTASVQSGSIPGIVSIKIELVNESGAVLQSVTDSQINIVSGPPHSITFSTSQHGIANLNDEANEDPVFGFTPGFYSVKGGINVTDKYGNAVSDGTGISLGVVDSIIVEGTTGETAVGGTTFYDISPKLADGTLITFADARISRNGELRRIEPNDRLMIFDAITDDKLRYVENYTSSATQVELQQQFFNKDSNLEYIVGASTLGASIFGINKDTTGTAIATNGYVTTKNGLAEFRLIYPSKNDAILTGCIDPSQDTRVSPAGSADVYLVASARNGTVVSFTDDFCYHSVAGGTITPSLATITKEGTYDINLLLEDGGDGIELPFANLFASVAITAVAVNASGDPINPIITITPQVCTTDRYGFCTSRVSISNSASGTSATINYTNTDRSGKVDVLIP